jgi:hypothetical protein
MLTEKVGVDEAVALENFARFQGQRRIEHGAVVNTRVKLATLAARIR